ncbi:RidA family protein [Streptomyces sp. NPDC059009]|uniref:RidA family protein n=1 Tax=Streptomyces sp. NPDC059009 TaxID=3346694 RepID=UPI00367E8A73
MDAPFFPVHPEDHPPTAARYSPAVVVPLAGGTSLVLVSGQVAKDPAGDPVAAHDTGRQTERVLDLLDSALAACGGGLADLVSLVVYVLDMADLPAVSEVRNRRLGDPPPTSTVLQVSALAKPEFRVEISAMAVISTTVDRATL